MNNLPILLLFLSIIVTTFNRGFFNFPALTMVGSIFVILLYVFHKNININLKNDETDSFQHLFVIVFSVFLFFSGGIYQENNIASVLLYFLPIVFYPLVLTYILDLKSFTSRTLKIRFYSLIILAILLRILIIIASPSPIIDVFTILKEAPSIFLSGGNPYDSVYSPVYPGIVTNYFPYWPAAFLLQIPFIALFGDPRVLLALSDILAALGLYLIGKKNVFAQILVLIYLFRPNSNFILEQSWITPLSYFLLVLAVLILKYKKELLLGIILGLASALQPLFIVFLPFFLVLVKNWKRIVITFLIALILLTGPFFLENPIIFLDKTILVYIKPISLVPTIPISLSLNLSTALFTFTGKELPNFISLSALSILFIFILVKLYIKKKITDLGYVLLGTTLFFYGFYLFFRQAFINYYYFAGSLILLWLMVTTKSKRNT